MPRIVKAILGIVLLFALNILFINAASPPESGFGLGLKPITPDESKIIDRNRILKVYANQRAVDRVNSERAKKNLQLLPRPSSNIEKVDYTITDNLGATTSTSTSTATSTLAAVPAQVDNSTLAAFPKIGNQGGQSSCVAWATTYYLMSHQICMSLGCDNKNLAERVYSPRWTYNMINGGVDAGSNFSSAFSLLSLHGAAKMSELPYNSFDPLSWDMNPADWRNALDNRVTSNFSVGINTDTGMASVKQLLANGNVVTFGTYISSWQYANVQSQPSTTSPFQGQTIVISQNGSLGGHAMTIVGYDDSIWVDMNASGIVDAGEVGAFKIANSWGAAWGNAGYVWASYDAFRTTSSVSGFAPSGRIQLSQNGSAYYYNYNTSALKLVGLVTVAHAARNQMSLQFGSSSNSVQTPQVYNYPFALSNKGGAYAFDGGVTEVESSFYFDLSNLLTSSVDQQLFYLMARDNLTGQALTVRSFQVIDPVSGVSLGSSANVPLVADLSTQKLIVGNYVADALAPTVPQNLTGSVATTKRGKSITSAIKLSWQASSDANGVAKYSVYRNSVKIADTSSLSYSDTGASTGVIYTYQVTATDTSGNESAKSNSVSLSK